MMSMFKRIKQLLKSILNNTKGEYSFRIEPSEFTAEQSAAFDRMVDFLARMVEKYGPMLDDIVKSEVNKKAEKQTA